MVSTRSGRKSRAIEVTPIPKPTSEDLSRAKKRAALGSSRRPGAEIDAEQRTAQDDFMDSITHSVAQDSVILPKLPYLGRDVILAIIGFADQPTLHAWQQVDFACYYFATPLLYNHLHIYSIKVVRSLAFGLDLPGCTPEETPPRSPDLYDKAELLGLVTRVTIHTQLSISRQGLSEVSRLPLKALHSVKIIRILDPLILQNWKDPVHNLSRPTWRPLCNWLEQLPNPTYVVGFPQASITVTQSRRETASIIQDRLGDLSRKHVFQPTLVIHEDQCATGPFRGRPLRILMSDTPRNIVTRFSMLLQLHVSPAWHWNQRGSQYIISGIGYPQPGLAFQQAVTPFMNVGPTVRSLLAEPIIGSERECQERMKYIMELLLQRKGLQVELVFETREESKKWYDQL